MGFFCAQTYEVIPKDMRMTHIKNCLFCYIVFTNRGNGNADERSVFST